jgi:hypothetical protein
MILKTISIKMRIYNILEKYWRIADTDTDPNRIERYLIIAWFLDI